MSIPILVLKGALGLLFASLILWFSIVTWNQANGVRVAEEPLPGHIVAYSDTAAASSTFWLDFQPGRPEESHKSDNIRFLYRLEQTPAEPTSVSFLLSGSYAEMLDACEQQVVDIDKGLHFDQLPQSARLALVALEQRGRQSSGGGGQKVLMDSAEASKRASDGVVYTKITLPVAPKPGGSEDKKFMMAEGNYRCGANLDGMWTSVSGGYRLQTPPMAASAPYTSTSAMTIRPEVSIDTDDKFFMLRSSHESKQSGKSTAVSVQDNDRASSEGFDTSVATSMAATFTSSAVQDAERNLTLFIGVLLGAAASIIIAVFSGFFDLLVRRWGTDSR